MPLDSDELAEVVSKIFDAHRSELDYRLDPIHLAVKGASNHIYVPRSATSEYKALVDQARFNVLPLVVGVLAQALYVDGYRAARQERNHRIWDDVWQPNRMDARQAGLYRAAIQYGSSYALVLPDRRAGAAASVSITPYSPRSLTALYADPVNDEWPEYAVVWGRSTEEGRQAWLYDDEQAYGLLVSDSGDATLRVDAEGEPMVRAHNLGVCPVVRYVDSFDDLDDGPSGRVWPLLPIQRQLNQTTFSLLMAQQYAAFRQRWATGMAIAEDERGAPVEPFEAAVNRVWQNESADGRFGDFEATDLRPYLEARDKLLLFVATTTQTPPHNMVVGAGISNIAAEALAALEAGHRQDIAEHQNSFGESTEQLMRLCGLAAGDRQTWEDRSAEVVWRDTTPRSLGQIADAWGKVAQMLDVPKDQLWSKLPISQQEEERWRARLEDQQLMTEIGGMLGDDAGEVRQRADALGVLIRAGVDPETAAERSGLDVDFTGAVPVSLRLPERQAAALEDA